MQDFYKKSRFFFCISHFDTTACYFDSIGFCSFGVPLVLL